MVRPSPAVAVPIDVTAAVGPTNPDRVKIVYILGSGRCGSTLLDAILGTAPDAFAAGEIDALPRAMRHSGEGRHEGTLTSCSCGMAMSECPVWSTIWREAIARFGLDSFRGNYGAYGRILISLARTLAARLLRTRRFRAELDHLAFVAESLREHSGRSVIVDSSKNPTRGWLYGMLPRARFDVRYVHLIRDGRRVLNSYMLHFDPTIDGPSQPPWGVAGTAVYSSLRWMYLNAHSSLLGRRFKDRYVRVDFESMMLDPVGELRRIGRATGIDMGEPISRILTSRAFDPGHIVMGNRSKFRLSRIQPGIRVGPPRLSRRSAWVFAVLAGWLNRMYRY